MFNTSFGPVRTGFLGARTLFARRKEADPDCCCGRSAGRIPSESEWTGHRLEIEAVQTFVNALVDRAAELAAVLAVVALPIYVITFLVWATLRRIVLVLDRRRYRYLAGPNATPGSLDWKAPASDDRPGPPEAERT